jgi:5-formyltetrahydrofolate cyclo-ligase
MRAARREVGSAEAVAAGEAIVAHWAREPSLAGVRRVLLYAALPDELPTRPLFEHLRSRGVETLFPRCAAEQLRYFRVDAWSTLSPGRYGVLEPPARAPRSEVDPEDLVLLPGIAFDREGNRLGQGQGWYDRTFAEHDRGCLIGAGFALQVVATVPAGSRDRGVGMILTERGFTRVTRTA